MTNLSDKGVSITAAPKEDKMPSLLGILIIMVSNVITNWSMDIFSCVKCKVVKVEQWDLEDQKQNLLNEATGQSYFQ